MIITAHCHKPHRAQTALQNFISHTGEMKSDHKDRHPDGDEKQRPQHGFIDGGPPMRNTLAG